MKEYLREEIERKREELFEVTKSTSLTSRLALKYSEELDLLLNQYESIVSHDLQQTAN
ncbi:Spo0E family sporulation regulatory protein-aspartic acid phosphatase [Siminovitchia acidinfaciens]|uniref:Spo0E family sporulation regulatory protein-aspartic acid phosphatase n=1 Tax=Siminovitchia acidinfaciens TaxID=2321395 RepID=A0A429XTU8_9BACI|nr:Spo0E family sporulation regulatory protein-aspartic acid phosphatase [Siminovitchia acidinfaciens]RST71270.1 Spo0E family sporulation regulatory protein-aspartic acid phosphatase [Siminovitchia acidinfaciens]VEF48267.1 Spo0A-P phosphatase [Bacillus freudenreichii]